jgi:hypothetical protein
MASSLRDTRDYRFMDWARPNGSGFAIENKLAHGEAMMPIRTIRSCDARNGTRVVLSGGSSRPREGTLTNLQDELIDVRSRSPR